jgi:hypothetical protein
MYRATALSSERLARRFVLIALGGIVACADPSAPSRAPSTPNAIIIIGGHPIVFNAQLRGVGNPDIKPPTTVEGHLQLKVYETDAGLVAGWKAVIVDPECESSLLLGGAIYLIQDSEDFPNPEDVGLVDLVPPQATLGCGENVLQGVAPVSEGLVTRFVEDPENFSVVFFLQGGGALAGPLQLASPETTSTR